MKLALVSAVAVLVSFSAVACTAGDSPNDSASDEAAVHAGPADACSTLAVGPFTPGELGTLFSGSEDFTFDGKGGIVSRRGQAVVAVNAQTQAATTLGTIPSSSWGIRYQENGNLLVASPQQNKIFSLAPDGTVSDFLTGLSGPNGIYVAHDGNVFLAEFGGRVSKIATDGTKTVYAQGASVAQGADGIVVDEDKGIVFYDEYQKGKINRIAVNAAPGTAPVAVATIPGAALDGMLLDECGNILVLDNGRSRLFRVRTDVQGNAVGQPELLASFPKNVAAANFGAGPGFDPKTLYVTGNPGVVYTLQLGVGGKNVVHPAAPVVEPTEPTVPPTDPAGSTH
ncbi:MAG: gluconolactonase [Labilithrix sp.]